MKPPSSTTTFEFLDYHSGALSSAGNLSASHAHSDPTKSNISVKQDAFWSYCGPILSCPEDIPSNLHEWAAASLSGSLLPLFIPFLTFVNDLILRRGLDHYWLTIRATKATDEYDKPRWHTDDMFFSSQGRGSRIPVQTPFALLRGQESLDLKTDWKVCTTLLGPSTMFIPPEHQAHARDVQRSTKRASAVDHACTSIRCLGCATAADIVRDQLASQLRSLGRVQAKAGECCFFRIGHDNGAVHSEPSISAGDRIFVNVVPGKQKELGNLMTKWGMSFPRAWWIAPKIGRAF